MSGRAVKPEPIVYDERLQRYEFADATNLSFGGAVELFRRVYPRAEYEVRTRPDSRRSSKPKPS
jgi:hypothetical protein